MINKLKNNTRIKLISFLSAIALWMYVMAVVDPEETRVIEDVPISISNMSELKENDLVIYPETELTTDIKITGKLSNIQKVKKDRIHISGHINDPIEGNNKIYLRANISERVSHEFKNDIEIVNLEKKIEELRDINVTVEGRLKDNIQVTKLSKDTVEISGPRSLVKQVSGVVGVLNVDEKKDSFSQKVKLEAIDKDGNKVDNVEMSRAYINVEATLLTQKNVPIKVNFSNTEEVDYNPEDYEFSKNSVLIKGKKEILDTIESIETKPVNLKDINASSPKDAILVIPEGILAGDKYITIKLKSTAKNSIEFNYSYEDIEIRNDTDNAQTADMDSSSTVKVRIEDAEDLSNVLKSDIVLYIDLSDKKLVNNEYEIKYDTRHKFDKVTIEPSVLEMK
ncbi:CdaR family protein [Asaccharospora irregularis]|uniref:YbbR domain-containing protein n=1 Tax=Asaccharospora irregularis DSM 2635 TaxID=1121321 RepID=A0A1M5SYU3_9FIRM|nr:CdaR family protein [Asaccharospora irregularis]SHH43697.1 YbbR domain-containing protein [Asaccharospora irregularis DSM 2635]